MTKDFGVKEKLQSHVSVNADVSVAQARASLEEAAVELVLITVTANVPPAEQPASILGKEQLTKLAQGQERKLSELLKTLPPILIMEADEVKYADLLDVLHVLVRTKARGFVARAEDGSVGVVPRSAVERALPRAEVAFAGAERGELRTPARTYVCRKCDPTRYKRPRAGGAPMCDVWSHGAMQEE